MSAFIKVLEMLDRSLITKRELLKVHQVEMNETNRRFFELKLDCNDIQEQINQLEGAILILNKAS